MEEKKLYGIFRIEKVKLCDGGEIMGRLKHAFREFNNDSFDLELTKYNNTFFFRTAKEVMKAYKDRVQSITTEKYKPPKNAVGIYECMFTSTAGAIPKDREQEFFERTYKQLCQTFGKENVLVGAVHRDETTVHTHWTGSPALMSELQDTMWEGIFKHFGLERGEVDLTADRTKKKKNVRSDIKNRDMTLARKEREQKLIDEKLAKERNEQNKRENDFLKEKASFKQEKSDFAEEMETASQKAVEKYDEYMKSKDFQNGEFPRVPVPDYKEGAYHYHLRIKPFFDAIVSRTQQFLHQIKVLKKNHQEEIEKLNDEYKAELEKVKADSAADNQTAIEKAVQEKAAEKDVTINSLKEEVQKEKTEKEKWYTMLFKKFTIKIGGQPVEVNKGLTDAYIEKSSQLAEWENRNGDELITLGTSYKKFRIQNWKEYLLAKSRPRTVDYDMSR